MIRFAIAFALPFTLSLASCGDSSDSGGATSDAGGAGGSGAGGGTGGSSAGGGGGGGAGAGEDLDMAAEDFECIQNGTKVRKFYVSNPLGHLDEALAVANSPTGGSYPVGTILQLVPQEAMVKRAVGWDTETNDWEFFALSVSGSATTISTRGAKNTVNAFGGNCLDCHALADPQWDLVCESDHGCAALPLSDSLIESLQSGDSRCD